ncbi:Nucleoporin nup84 [Myotisia sp. PD_48]|nr:Nucleoporin nup84 [Myotisia sp. PD_48]
MSHETDSSHDESESMFSEDSPVPPARLHSVEIIEIDSDDDEGDQVIDEDSAEGGTEGYSDELSDDDNGYDEHELEDENDDEEEEGGEEDHSHDSMEVINIEDDDEDEEEEPGDEGLEEEQQIPAEPKDKFRTLNGTFGNGIQAPERINGINLQPRKGSDIITVTSRSSSPRLLPQTHVKDALHPLKRTADRVTKQMEAFAQSLDNFRKHDLKSGDLLSFVEASTLAEKYKEISGETVKQLSNSAAPRKLEKRFATSKKNQPPDVEKSEMIRKLQLEADTWDLLSELLHVCHPDSYLQAERNRKIALESLHRYSSDQDVWEKFLQSDHFALECAVIFRWVEKSNSSAKEVDTMIATLENAADRGQGLWAHGWLYTKEAIKGAKRLRSWPQPLEPDDPTVTASLLSSDQNTPLITQLDPDAVTRQGLGLLKQDESFEEATWLTCWKMLRTGESWPTIREWAKQRLESWRAISLCGSSGESWAPDSSISRTSLLRMMNYRTQESWRIACSALANNPGSNRYERAVYAIISGETGPAYEVCRDWSDYLYVYCNHILLSRYRDFCKQFQRKLSSGITTLTIEPPGYEGLQNFLISLGKDPRTMEEVKNPYRTIQSAIIARSYDHFFYHQANAAIKAVHESEESSLIRDTATMTTLEEPVLIAAKDHDAIRLIAHLLPIMQAVGFVRTDSQFTKVVSNNIVRYIDVLRIHGLVQAMPLYCSLLPREMCNKTLAVILIEVVSPHERRSVLQPMNRLKINVASVLLSQWHWALAEAAKTNVNEPIRLKKTVAKDGNEPARIIPIKKGLLSQGKIAPEDEKLIRCVDWLRYVPHQWPRMCNWGTYLYKQFITAGKFITARELLNRTQLSQVPIDTTGFELAQRDDGPDNDVIMTSPTQINTAVQQINGAQTALRRKKQTLEDIFQVADTMKELEQLIRTYDVMDKWGNLLSDYQHSTNVARKRDLGPRIQTCLDEFTATIEPLCRDWLIQPKDDIEAKELEFIRSTYLPEVLLAYHSALYHSGHILGREVFAQCMTLATVIAGSQTLVECFMAADRMQELVDALALSSFAILRTKDSTLKRKLPHGATLDIWKIKPVEKEDDEDDQEYPDEKRQKLNEGKLNGIDLSD